MQIDAVDTRTWSPDQIDKLRKGLCFACGKAGHMKRACPRLRVPDPRPRRDLPQTLGIRAMNEIMKKLRVNDDADETTRTLDFVSDGP